MHSVLVPQGVLRPGEHHAPHVPVPLQALEHVGQLADHVGVECVQLLLAVNGHDREVRVPLHTHVPEVAHQRRVDSKGEVVVGLGERGHGRGGSGASPALPRG